MKHYFLNGGEPDETGTITAMLEEDDGRVISRYTGSNMAEVADKVLKGAAHATQALGELRRRRQPDAAPVQPRIGEPRELSADDKWRIASEISDPAKATDAIVEAVAAKLGASVDEIRQVLIDTQKRNSEQYYYNEAMAFYTAHPEFLRDEENIKRLFLRLQQKGNWEATRNNYEIVYDELVQEGALLTQDTLEDWRAQQGVTLPVTPTGEPATAAPAAAVPEGRRQGPTPSMEPAAPARPRFAETSTGLRPSQASGTRPAPATPKLTRKQVEDMSQADYAARYADPKFRAEVAALYSAKRA